MEEEGLLLELIGKYLDGTATLEEIRLVDKWYDSMEVNEGLTGNMSPEALKQMQRSSFDSLKSSIKNYPLD